MELTQKFISSRRGTIALAVLAAFIAGTLILVYVNRYRTSVRSQGAPVTVLVARTTIPKGTSGSVVASKSLYTTATVRQAELLDGALSDTSALAGRAASQDIYSGQQLTAAEFAGSASSVASTLSRRERVMTIPLDSAHGLSGNLRSGDRVDVFAGFNVVPVNARGVPVAGGQARPILRLIMQGVRVISVGGGAGGVASGNAAYQVTLKVDDIEAAQLAFASDNGKLWLALRPASGAKASRPSAVTAETLLLGIPPITVIKSLGGH